MADAAIGHSSTVEFACTRHGLQGKKYPRSVSQLYFVLIIARQGWFYADLNDVTGTVWHGQPDQTVCLEIS